MSEIVADLAQPRDERSLDAWLPGRAFQQVFVWVSGLLVAASAVLTMVWCLSMSAMHEMPMPGGWSMSMTWMRMPEQTWPGAAASYLGMWVVMMVAMMGPSVLPVLAQYRRTANSQAAAQMAAGYYFVYAVIGTAAYPFGIALALAAMRWPMVSRMVPFLSAGALVIAGGIQWTPWKMAHLRKCRDPLHCCASAKDGTPQGPWGTGLRWGVSCALCCSGIMLALFVLGMMDLWVILILTGVITLERLLPRPERVAQIAGVAAIVTGMMMLGHPFLQR